MLKYGFQTILSFCLLFTAAAGHSYLNPNAGYGKLENLESIGIPAFRITAEAGVMNPVLGGGVSLEFPKLLNTLSLAVYGWYGYDYIVDRRDFVYTNGVNYLRDYYLTGRTGIYGGARLGLILSSVSNVSEHSVELERQNSGGYVRTWYLSASYPIYDRTLLVADFSMEPIGTYVINRNFVALDGTQLSNTTLLSEGYRPMLKLLFQWENIYGFKALAAYVKSDSDIPVVKTIRESSCFRGFIGPMTGITDGIGAYGGINWGYNNLYLGLEGGVVFFLYRAQYIPFKATIGFFL